MTWSNVGDEPGRIKIPKDSTKGAAGRSNLKAARMMAKPPSTLGGQRGESVDERRARLRRIARGEHQR